MKKREGYIDDDYVELLPSRAVPVRMFIPKKKGGESMPIKKVPCQVWLPNRLNNAIKAACKWMSKKLDEHYSRARFMREAAEKHLKEIETEHNKHDSK